MYRLPGNINYKMKNNITDQVKPGQRSNVTSVTDVTRTVHNQKPSKKTLKY